MRVHRIMSCRVVSARRCAMHIACNKRAKIARNSVTVSAGKIEQTSFFFVLALSLSFRREFVSCVHAQTTTFILDGNIKTTKGENNTSSNKIEIGSFSID